MSNTYSGSIPSAGPTCRASGSTTHPGSRIAFRSPGSARLGTQLSALPQLQAWPPRPPRRALPAPPPACRGHGSPAPGRGAERARSVLPPAHLQALRAPGCPDGLCGAHQANMHATAWQAAGSRPPGATLSTFGAWTCARCSQSSLLRTTGKQFFILAEPNRSLGPCPGTVSRSQHKRIGGRRRRDGRVGDTMDTGQRCSGRRVVGVRRSQGVPV